jgi:hypothetical protein
VIVRESGWDWCTAVVVLTHGTRTKHPHNNHPPT